MEYSATKRQRGQGHSQTVLKAVHNGFQTGEGENWYQSKWKLSKRKEKKKAVNMRMVTVYAPILFALKTSDKWLTCML